MNTKQLKKEMREIVVQFVMAEREACAKLSEANPWIGTGKSIARQIRARPPVLVPHIADLILPCHFE